MNPFDLIQSAVAGNDVFAGGFALGLIGVAAAYARALPGRLWSWLLRQVTVEVDVLGSDPAFGWLRIWLAEHPYSRRARRLSVSVRVGNRDADLDTGATLKSPGQEDAPRIVLSPAPGLHLLRWGRSWILLRRQRDEVQGSRDSGSTWRESYRLRLLGRSPETARALLDEARESAERWGRRPGVRVLRREYANWHLSAVKPERTADSVVLPGDTMERLLADAKVFTSSRAWYEERGIPYRRGYLLHGVPGSGKSSAILALASALGRPVYDVGQIDAHTMEGQILMALACTEEGGIVLFEDIDTLPVVQPREVGGERGEGLSLASLLNALDGVGAPEGRIVVMTTNHPERLDPALVRPGRIDARIAFGQATGEQAERLFRRFFPEAPLPLAAAFGEAVEGREKSMAELQEHLLRHRDNPERAAEGPA